jgi:hypothetical protein
MRLKETIRRVLHFCFMLGFLGTLIVAFNNMIKPEIGTSFDSNHDGKMPSITICPLSYDLDLVPVITRDSNHTFNDILTKIPSLLDQFQAILNTGVQYSTER